MSEYTRDALGLAEHVDCGFADLECPQQNPKAVHADIRQRYCHWYLPVFANPFYGGVMTILRLAAHLQDAHGVRQRFLVCGECDESHIANLIASAFPTLGGSDVLALNAERMRSLPPADYSVATLWTTAYVLLTVKNTGYKFYMIQDFEPLFYPAGSTFAQAELTYRFGFYGLANTGTLCEIYEAGYGGKAVAFSPCVDPSIFFPGRELPSVGAKRLFYYARPGTPRNGFELAAVVLRRVKQKLGEGVDIVCAGAVWRPEDFGLGGIVRSVGVLPYEQTAALYRTCHASLVLMMTKHPSYLPFELMACGSIVVSNYNPSTTWFLKDKQNCLLSQPSAACLTDTIVHALENYAELRDIRTFAVEQIRREHADWDREMDKVAQFMHKPGL